MDPQVWVAGLAVGLLVGMTGMGGGSLMTPILIFVFGVRPIIAVGTDLAATAITKIFGGWQHYRQGTVHLPIVKYLVIGSVPGALVGVGLLALLERVYHDSVDGFVTTALGVALVLMAAMMIGRTFLLKRSTRETLSEFAVGPRAKRALPIVGFLVGIAVGITSVGSGAIIIVVLSFVFAMPSAKIVGTDVFHASLIVSTAALAHLTVGYIDTTLLANLLVGSIPGVYIGSRLAAKVPEKALRGTLAVVLLASGLKLV